MPDASEGLTEELLGNGSGVHLDDSSVGGTDLNQLNRVATAKPGRATPATSSHQTHLAAADESDDRVLGSRTASTGLEVRGAVGADCGE
jgi:hypothetical protein